MEHDQHSLVCTLNIGDHRRTRADHEADLEDAQKHGVRKVELTGDNPTVIKEFEHIVLKARNMGFELIEIHSDLNYLSASLLMYCKSDRVRFVTPVYGSCAEAHDAFTGSANSFLRTTENVQLLDALNIAVQVVVVPSEDDPEDADAAVEHIKTLGIADVLKQTAHP